MAKINFYHIEDIEKEAIFEEVAAKTGMTAFTVEKDWWMVQALSVVFDMPVAQHLVFKGGTCTYTTW